MKIITHKHIIHHYSQFIRGISIQSPNKKVSEVLTRYKGLVAT